MKTQYFNMDRERITGATRVITSDHANIHDGEGFELSISAEGVADNGTVLIELTTPAVRYAHLKQISPWAEGGVASIDILEGSTSSGGTDATPVNKKRVGTPVAATVTAKTGVTPSGGTAIMPPVLFGGGGAGQGTAGGNSMDNEWVLKPETKYVIRVTNLAGAAKALSLYLFWYEEDGA